MLQGRGRDGDPGECEVGVVKKDWMKDWNKMEIVESSTRHASLGRILCFVQIYLLLFHKSEQGELRLSPDRRSRTI